MQSIYSHLTAVCINASVVSMLDHQYDPIVRQHVIFNEAKIKKG